MMELRTDDSAASAVRVRRLAMVQRQIRDRGITNERVLAAFERVPREHFVRPDLAEFAYDDTPLPIDEQQTISQPYIVAYMVDQLRLRGDERVLEVGAGSGYAAAVLSELAGEVVAIERHAALAANARERLERLGRKNVSVIAGDGTLGYAAKAPYDAILVSAGGAVIPEALKEQLAIGGRLIIPVGPLSSQRLIRVVRTAADRYEETSLSRVMFVPLVGAEHESRTLITRAPALEGKSDVVRGVASRAEPFDEIEHVDLAPWRARVGNARVVALGESTHGTSEFYRMRARLSRELIEHEGFNLVAIEADWPDVAVLDRYIGNGTGRLEIEPFSRFPQWMWRNEEFEEFLGWLREHNLEHAPSKRVHLCGLDLYSMSASTAAVIEVLERLDPSVAQVAKERYSCLTPWQSDPTSYGAAVVSGRYEACAAEVVAVLNDLLAGALANAADQELAMDALGNARVVANAEKYYRTMFFGGAQSWNLRDQHMFDTLEALLAQRPDRKAIVWAHNSHLGDARATDFAARGEHNLGQLIRQAFGADSYLIGFGTHEGTVMAAHAWDGSPEVMTLRPSLEHSIERVCHDTGIRRFLLPVRHQDDVRKILQAERLERAVGVVYRPRSERLSHYFFARVGDQFDEYIWFDHSSAVQPMEHAERLLA